MGLIHGEIMDEEVWTMSDEEVAAQLRAGGFDPAEVEEVGRQLGLALKAAAPGEEVAAVNRVFAEWKKGKIKAPVPGSDNEQVFDPDERAREKQRSRQDDARALASGKKSREQLRQENSAFSFPKVRVSVRKTPGDK